MYKIVCSLVFLFLAGHVVASESENPLDSKYKFIPDYMQRQRDDEKKAEQVRQQTHQEELERGWGRVDIGRLPQN